MILYTLTLFLIGMMATLFYVAYEPNDPTIELNETPVYQEEKERATTPKSHKDRGEKMTEYNEYYNYYIKDGRYFDMETHFELSETEIKNRKLQGGRIKTYASVFEERYGYPPSKEELREFIKKNR